MVSANVDPNPTNIPADATVVRKAAPAQRNSDVREVEKHLLDVVACEHDWNISDGEVHKLL